MERRIDEELVLIPYYPNPEAALPWYQDPELCRQVDGRPDVYDPDRLDRMYTFLSEQGACYYIEYRGTLVGDVSLRNSGEIAVVVSVPYQNRHIGHRCVREMLALARERGMTEVKAQIYAFNVRSRAMFLSAGFTQADGDWYRCSLDGEPAAQGQPAQTEGTGPRDPEDGAKAP
ncbi:MAG: GNAT family N-acetyltransferase [Lachnospiraceae bacterium]|nr:GNAT family N-acetyltransferase [Lachnospiraceae bacterium]